jgi:UDP-3-O-[3-hydroxymyristoyl] N-acetylglucosamine deacetylase
VSFRVGAVEFAALGTNAVSTRRCTVLGAAGATVSTVEHLLAALYGLGIDNAVIEVEGPEIPILDGSAAPFAEGLLQVGVRSLDAPAPCLRLSQPIWLEGGTPGAPHTSVFAVPDERLRLTIAVDFGRPLAGPQVFSFSCPPPPPPQPPTPAFRQRAGAGAHLLLR